jgi:hypothetical protein
MNFMIILVEADSTHKGIPLTTSLASIPVGFINASYGKVFSPIKKVIN